MLCKWFSFHFNLFDGKYFFGIFSIIMDLIENKYFAELVVIAQSVKYFSHKHEELTVIPKDTLKELGLPPSNSS